MPSPVSNPLSLHILMQPWIARRLRHICHGLTARPTGHIVYRQNMNGNMQLPAVMVGYIRGAMFGRRAFRTQQSAELVAHCRFIMALDGADHLPNGLVQMAGNVEEMTATEFPFYLGRQGELDGFAELDPKHLITRGGSFLKWRDLARHAKGGMRDGLTPQLVCAWRGLQTGNADEDRQQSGLLIDFSHERNLFSRRCHVNHRCNQLVGADAGDYATVRHLPPLSHRVAAELAECSAGDQMALDVEEVVDGRMGRRGTAARTRAI